MPTATQEIKELRSEVEQLTARLNEKAKEAANSNSLANLAGFDRRDLKRAARKAGRKVRGYMSEKSRQASELKDNCEETIVSHPFSSVAAAVVSGVVVGSLLRRK